jgi:hypothetical protein
MSKNQLNHPIPMTIVSHSIHPMSFASSIPIPTRGFTAKEQSYLPFYSHLSSNAFRTTEMIERVILTLFQSRHTWNELLRIERESLEHQCRIYKEYILAALTHTHIAVSGNRLNSMAGLYTFMNDGGTHILHHEKAISNLMLLKDFFTINSQYMSIQSSDEDSFIDFFHLKVPVKYPNTTQIQWSNFQEVYAFITDTSFPVDPIPERTIRKTLNKAATIGFHLDSSPHSVIRAYKNVKKTIPIYNDPALLIPYVNIDHKHPHFGGIGKSRWTAAMLLHWTDILCHTAFTTATSPYIHQMIRTILIEEPVSRHEPRILIDTEIPDDVDPITLEAFKEGDQVIHLACCGKYLLKSSMDGIFESGRTPRCPFCRTRFQQTSPPTSAIENAEAGLVHLGHLVQSIPRITTEHIGSSR